MRYWSFEDGFGLDNLKLLETDVPSPGPGEVLLKMKACSLNYRDIVVLNGQHGKSVRPPLIPLSDGVGEVVEVGRDVTSLKTGDRVSPSFFQNWFGGRSPQDLSSGRLGGPRNGVLATHCVFPEASVVTVPEHLTDAEAATLPCSGVTAWSALSEPNPVRPGETVLILGTGGVALIAMQLAKASGAKTIVTTSTSDRAEQAKALGADRVIVRSETPDWCSVVADLTQGEGVDRVLELGGAETLMDSVKSVRSGGSIILIGNVTGNQAKLFLPLVLTRQITLRAVTVGSKQSFEALAAAVRDHEVRPVIGKTLGFEDAKRAFELAAQGTVFGNICVSIG